MARRLFICLLHYVSFTVSESTEISGPGVCTTLDGNITKCCTGYMFVANMCSECNPGYIGENCSLTCKPGYFGRGCNEHCHCSQDEYCDPARGCLCNSTSDNCREPELTTGFANNSTVYHSHMITELTTGFANKATVYQSHLNNILSSFVFAIAGLVVGVICFRMLYSKIMKRKDSHSVQNVTTTDKSEPCVDLHPDASPQQIMASIDIDCNPLSTVSQRVDEEMSNSKHRQQKNGFKTLMFSFPKSMNDAASRGQKMQAKHLVSPVPANDNELYANCIDLTLINKSFRPDSPMDKKDSGVQK